MGRQQFRQNQNTEPRSIFVQLLPLIILFAFSLLSALPNMLGTAAVPDPHFSFEPSAKYNVERQTGGIGVRYHVNSAEFTGHPAIGAELARERGDGKGKNKKTKRGPALTKFESTVDRAYTQQLYTLCQRGLDRKQRAKDQETGLFGIGTDWEKVRAIENEVVESCEELRRLGVIF